MAKVIQPLKNISNEEFLNGIRNDASLDYQRRVPEATKANIQDTMRLLSDNNPLYNEFVDALVNRIGLVIGRNMIWTNPLAEFKMGMLQYGNSIEEYGMGLLKAHTYDTDREALEKDIFGQELPEVKASFHKVNRQDWYKVTVNETLLMRAFLEPGGLSDFTTKLMQAPATSDAWDEFMLMCQLFAEYEKNDGFFKVNVPDVRAIESDATAAKAVVRKIRSTTGNVQFPSTVYNAAGLPTFAKPDELILFATPDFQAAMDVEALAAAFNPDRLTTPRIITIPDSQFGIAGAQAILTTRDFFVVADTKIQIEQARNPVRMHTNYFLHHHSILSASRFVPAILFTTEAGTETAYELPSVSSVSAIVATDRNNATVTSVKRGELYNVTAEAVTVPANGVNNGVRWSVSGATAPRTHVTNNGVLHVAGTEGATTLTVKATATWTDPNGLSQVGVSKTLALTVTGTPATDWPVVAGGTAAASTMGLRMMEAPSEDVPVDYTSKTVDELRELLAARDLDTSGVKAALVERLTEDDAKADA